MSCANQGLIISNLMKIHFFLSSLCSYEGYGSNSLALQEALKVTKYFMEKKNAQLRNTPVQILRR